MIFPPTIGPLWGSEISPEPRSWRETSGEHPKRSTPSHVNECPAYCWPSLGLGDGNTAGAEILEGDVWGALKIEHAFDSNGYCRASLGLYFVVCLCSVLVSVVVYCCVVCSVYVCSVCSVYCCVVCSAYVCMRVVCMCVCCVCESGRAGRRLEVS